MDFPKYHTHWHVPKDFGQQSRDCQGQQEQVLHFPWHNEFLPPETISIHELAQSLLNWDPRLQSILQNVLGHSPYLYNHGQL